jgi:DNA-binding GntR family transcriptional regulator
VSTSSFTKRRQGSDASQGTRATRAAKAVPKAAAPVRAKGAGKVKATASPAKVAKVVKVAKGAKAAKAAPRTRAPEPAPSRAARAASKPPARTAKQPAARLNAAPRKTQAAPRKTESTQRPAEAAGAAEPRYQQVARQLKGAIAGGQYPLGARLPTEAELCERFGISRFTAREAVRLLATAGLVTRRQRAGTVVIALPDEARYTPTLSSLNDLQQYARDTEMRIVQVGRVALDKARARTFDAEPGAQWIHAVGIRHETATGGAARGAGARAARGRERPGEGRPFCLVRIYLNPILAGIEGRLRTRRVAIYSIIESEFGHPIERVEQDLTGTLLDAEDAASLDATPGAAALCIVRRYYDPAGVLLQVAENVHPADRFTFRMQLRR